MQSIDLIETYAYGMGKYLVSEKEETKCNNIIKDIKMINFDDVTKENITKYNPNWPQVPDHPYKKSIIWGSSSGRKKLIS